MSGILKKVAIAFYFPPGHFQCQSYKDGGGSQKEANSKNREYIFSLFLDICELLILKRFSSQYILGS